MSTITREMRASDHSSYNVLMIVTFLIPFIGFIMGLIFLTKEKELDKKVGVHLVVASILFFIAWVIILAIIAASSATSSVNI